MEKLSLILIFIGLSVFLFSFWSFISIKRHLNKVKYSHRPISPLADKKYFELKARQEYIISISAIIFSIITFLGYTSIDNIKTDINERLIAEVKKLDSLKERANKNYLGLEIRGKTYMDSVNSAFVVLGILNKRMKQLYSKDVIRQDIYIVDPIRIGDWPRDKSDLYDEGYREIKFSKLKTVSGNLLPVFKERPSIICIANRIGSVKIIEIFSDKFVIQLESYLPKNNNDKGEDVTFTAWISQRSGDNSFSDDFSNDFK